MNTNLILFCYHWLQYLYFHILPLLNFLSYILERKNSLFTFLIVLPSNFLYYSLIVFTLYCWPYLLHMITQLFRYDHILFIISVLIFTSYLKSKIGSTEFIIPVIPLIFMRNDNHITEYHLRTYIEMISTPFDILITIKEYEVASTYNFDNLLILSIIDSYPLYL